MQGREGQVARFRHGQRRLNCFRITHFADENHVRILAQHAFQCGAERVRVRVDLALIHHAPVVAVEIFDGVFNRDDMGVALAVNLVHDRRQGRGLATTRRAADQHESEGFVSKVRDDTG